MKYTWHGQIFSVIIAHIEISFVFFFAWVLAISITGTKLGGLIYSLISFIFYIVAMYSQGYSIAKNDRKSYTKLSPFWYKGALVSLGLLVMNILVLLIYKLSWALGGNGEELTKVWAVAGNVFSLFWFSPYMNLLGMDKGSLAFYGYLTVILVHIIACFLGYYAGYKNFDISAKLRFLIYEKKKDSK